MLRYKVVTVLLTLTFVFVSCAAPPTARPPDKPVVEKPTEPVVVKPTEKPLEIKQAKINVAARLQESPEVQKNLLTVNGSLICPPICTDQQTQKPRADADIKQPLSFEVCSKKTGCFQIIAGQAVTITVSSDATIKAPETLMAFEEDNPLIFARWDDGVVTNPRPIFPSSGSSGENRSPGLASYSAQVYEAMIGAAIYHLANWIQRHDSRAAKSGCPVSEVELFLTNRQWAAVDGNSDFETVEGPLITANPAEEDYFGTHYTGDYIFWPYLERDEAYTRLLLSKVNVYGQREHQIQVEWEIGSHPAWIRPASLVAKDRGITPDDPSVDRVFVVGKWIYDCGHMDDSIKEGAWTEIHPPIAMATMRGTKQGIIFSRREMKGLLELSTAAKGLYGTKVDVWINGDGGKATEVISGKAAFPIDRKYQFDVPLPPLVQEEIPIRPPVVKWAVLRLQTDQPQPKVELIEGNTKLRVTIDLTGYKDKWSTCRREGLTNCRGDAYGFTLIAGRELRILPKDLHFLRLTAYEIETYDDYEGEDGSGEFELWLAAGPSQALGIQDSVTYLTGLSSGVLRNAEAGRKAALTRQDKSPLMLDFKVWAKVPGNDFTSLKIYGFEEDPIWNDPFTTVERRFESTTTIWRPKSSPFLKDCMSGVNDTVKRAHLAEK